MLAKDCRGPPAPASGTGADLFRRAPRGFDGTEAPPEEAAAGMELAQELSNPELGPALDRLETALTKLRRRTAMHKVTIDFGSPRQGDVLEAIKVLLAEHPANGLRQSEVRREVERRLGRKVSPSTVRTNLAYNPAFERIGYAGGLIDGDVMT